MTVWAIEDSDDQVLLDFACASRVGVERRIVPVRFDVFRLQVWSSYCELFEGGEAGPCAFMVTRDRTAPQYEWHHVGHARPSSRRP
jgi:hypothetical protein